MPCGIPLPDGVCVPRWVWKDLLKGAVMSEIVTVGLEDGRGRLLPEPLDRVQVFSTEGP